MATYYVSVMGCDNNNGTSPDTPWRTINKANLSVKGGDTVCLRRGDTFFGAVELPRRNESGEPTVYKDYGQGPKPVISQYKTVHGDSWEEYGEQVWRADLKDISKFSGNVTELDVNAGFLKVDGQIKARKRFALGDLCDRWDFYNDDRYLYVLSDRCPALAAKEIQVACNIICMRFANDIRVENIVFMGTGAHGISGTVRRATVRNCEFHEIGGSELLTYHLPCVRYGNGVECWCDSSDVLVEGCRFSGIYDVAMTMQGDCEEFGWRNITFRNNVVWNCQQCFEIWSSGKVEDTGFENCVFENNVCIDSGYCWGYEVRPNKDCSCHLLMYSLLCPRCDVTVRGNTFYRARVAPVFKSGGPGGIPDEYRIVDNTFFVDPGQDIAFRADCDDTVYDGFLKRVLSENRIIESGFPEI